MKSWGSPWIMMAHNYRVIWLILGVCFSNKRLVQSRTRVEPATQSKCLVPVSGVFHVKPNERFAVKTSVRGFSPALMGWQSVIIQQSNVLFSRLHFSNCEPSGEQLHPFTNGPSAPLATPLSTADPAVHLTFIFQHRTRLSTLYHMTTCATNHLLPGLGNYSIFKPQRDKCIFSTRPGSVRCKWRREA